MNIFTYENSSYDASGFGVIIDGRKLFSHLTGRDPIYISKVNMPLFFEQVEDHIPFCISIHYDYPTELVFVCTNDENNSSYLEHFLGPLYDNPKQMKITFKYAICDVDEKALTDLCKKCDAYY